MLIYGLNPVFEALGAGRVRQLHAADRPKGRVAELIAAAERAGVPVQPCPAATLDRMARGGVHQGVVAEVEEARKHSLSDLVKGAAAAPLIVVLDGVEDPHNVGAILRTVDAAGADGLVRQSRHAASLDGAAAKASAT